MIEIEEKQKKDQEGRDQLAKKSFYAFIEKNKNLETNILSLRKEANDSIVSELYSIESKGQTA